MYITGSEMARKIRAAYGLAAAWAWYLVGDDRVFVPRSWLRQVERDAAEQTRQAVAA